MLRHGRSSFGRRAEPERSEAVLNGEGVASGGATICSHYINISPDLGALE